MEIVLVGLNHRTAPLQVRERLAVSDETISRVLPALLDRTGATEGMILSTCNRTEILAAGRSDPHPSSSDPHPSPSDSLLKGCAVLRAFCDLCGQSEVPPDDAVYEYQDEDAVRHLYEVAAGLDSMVLGEPQIFGQLKQAYSVASECGATGLYVNKALHGAFRAGKRVRAETDLAAGAVSMAYVAVVLAAKVFGNLSAHRALVIGAGEMAEAATMHLSEQGVVDLFFSNRTIEKASALAQRFNGRMVPFERVCEALAEADVVISSTGAPGYVLTDADFHGMMAKRHTRPIVLIDIAVPRDIDPAINEHDNAFLYDVDSLRQVADENLERRKRAIPEAQALIEQELQSFSRWRATLQVEPVVKLLHDRFERVRRCEVEKNARRFCDKESEDLDKMTRAIQQKLLHRPTKVLRQCDPETEEGRRVVEIVRDLFDLG